MAREDLNKKKESKTSSPCTHVESFPNNWGHQEFDGKYLSISSDKQRDVNAKLDRFSFIRDFQVKYIDGIKLKKPQEKKICKDCNC